MEHCKCFTWNIVSVSRGTSQAFHVEHRKRFTWNTNGAQARAAAFVFASSSSLFGLACSAVGGCVRLASSSSLFGLACSAVGGCVRLRFFLLLVRACVLGCGRRRSLCSLAVLACARCSLSASSSIARLSCRPRLCALLPLCVVVCRSPLLPSSPVRAAPSLRRRLSLASLAATFTATGVTPHSSLPTAASRQPTADASLQPPDSRRTPAYSRQTPDARQLTADSSPTPPDSRQPTPAYSRPTADARQLTAARHPTHASLQPTADSRQPTPAYSRPTLISSAFANGICSPAHLPTAFCGSLPLRFISPQKALVTSILSY